MIKSKTIELLIIALIGLSIAPGAVHTVKAVAVASPGFAVSDFATGFANSSQFCSPLLCGPIGISFDTSGNLLVLDIQTGIIYKFGPAGGVANSLTQLNSVPLGGIAVGLTFSKDQRLYVSRSGSGDVAELDPSTGTVLRSVASIPSPNGIATDPLSGDLFASSGGQIWRISNFSTGPGTASPYTSTINSDGLAFGPDGTLYAASGACGGPAKVDGTNTSTPGSFTCLASVPTIDGMAVSANPTRPLLFANRNDGTITEVNLTTTTPTLTDIIIGGSRGDFVTVGSDGCLYATQSDRVLKVTNADGSCLPPPLGPLFPSNPRPGLVHYWPADGNTTDVIGGNNGTLNNGAGYRPGIVGQAFSFNGNGQYVQALNPVSFGSGDFTIDLWAKFSSPPGGSLGNPSTVFIGDDNGAGCSDKWFFALGGGVLNFHINTPGCTQAGFFAQYPFSPNLNQWYNLAVTREAGNITIYVDCTAVSSQLTPDTSNPTNPLTIGWTNDDVGFFNGLIDEVRIYNFATSIQGICTPPQQLSVSKFFTDSSLNPLPTDQNGSPKLNVVLARGTVTSTNPGQIVAWVNVTNTGSSALQSLMLNETLPVDWTVHPSWLPAKGAIRVFYANTTSLGTNPDITVPSTIRELTGNPETVELAIPDFSQTLIGHALGPGQSILLGVKLQYGLIGTTQSSSTYPRSYPDTATAEGWLMPSYTGTGIGPGTRKGSFVAYAKVVGDVNGDGHVDVTDLALVGVAFGSHTGGPNWNSAADLTGKGYVDVSDLAVVGGTFGS